MLHVLNLLYVSIARSQPQICVCVGGREFLGGKEQILGAAAYLTYAYHKMIVAKMMFVTLFLRGDTALF